MHLTTWANRPHAHHLNLRISATTLRDPITNHRHLSTSLCRHIPCLNNRCLLNLSRNTLNRIHSITRITPLIMHLRNHHRP